ncbi:hypothetical protein EQG63_06070 [Flavobacterium amnicola]|uniref:Periplasmic heavy metal sensor n=1 Tax=Flavobacterium amnicola TaxID=2506422 RepID=A0A4V1N1X3_9FLAO|nr:hypothetical protein [Flavobacterium amnicola]RXR19008.1 hypothetical protein EQG63_06070 [Flavobacterium amnicola]
MNKSKFLYLLVVIMLVINVGIISYLFFTDGIPLLNKGKEMPREIVIKKLVFDDQQIKAYDLLIKGHQQKIRFLNDAIRAKKNELYSHLKDNATPISENDRLVKQIANYQSQIEITHYNHFLDIKKICRPEQLENYNELTTELAKIFSHPRRPKHAK